jgi:predicted AAA+ superfamily ATPase
VELYGLRRAGKTVSMFHMIDEPINRILDDIELLNKDKKDLNFSNRLLYEM